MTAATVYPGALDTFDAPGSTLAGAPLHSDLHKHLASAVRAIEVALGTNPTISSNDPATCDGRLSFTSGLPVTTADVTAAATIYFTPDGGNKIALFNGTTWDTLTFTELSLSIAAATSGKGYDVFAYNNAGTAALEMLAWTDGTTRATAITYQDGIKCKTGALTRRLLGSFYANGSGTSEDSKTKRFLSNLGHKRARPLLKNPAATSTYGTTTVRQMNADAANQVEFFTCWAEDSADFRYNSIKANATGNVAALGLGLDSTTAFASQGAGADLASNNVAVPSISTLSLIPAVGYHKVTILEVCGAGGTLTNYYTGAFGAASALAGSVMG